RSFEARACPRAGDDQDDDQQRMEYGSGVGDRGRGAGPGAVADGRRSPPLLRSLQEQTEAGVHGKMSERESERARERESEGVGEHTQQSVNTAREIINPPDLVRPRGFSHGIVVEGGRLLMLAGQDASDADGRVIAPGDLVAQYEQVVKNLKAVVEAAGGGLQD